MRPDLSGQRRSITCMIRSAHRIASAMALIVAGTYASLPYLASFLAARMLAAIKSTRFRRSSIAVHHNRHESGTSRLRNLPADSLFLRNTVLQRQCICESD